MFEAFLREHPLEGLLEALPGPLFPPASDREAWEGLDPSRREAIRRLAEEYGSGEYPVLKASQFMDFGRRGDRKAWEEPYFQRRRKLCAALLGACVDGSGRGIDDVVDGIWLICEESSWVISAHNGSDHEGQRPVRERLLPDVCNPYVDLFSAQTAMILSLACQLLAPELDAASPLIRRRVRLEVERRVLLPFETRDDFWWMGITRKDLCNWTPWILSNVMLTACAWVGDRLRLCELLERGLRMLDRYLAVLPGDGGCDEGPGYWSMAGGALLDCLELLERITGGRAAFWRDEKLRNILRFPLNAWLGGDWFINFADCDARPAIPGERLRYAGERLGNGTLVALGERFVEAPGDHLADTPQLWRLLSDLFHPGGEGPGTVEPAGDVWLPDLQVRILRRGGMTLACQGGVNAGGHSHNDCGSFMLYVDGEPQVVDAGNMTYTGKTFSDARYTLWNTRSMYHNVPMIGGYEQANGPQRRAEAVTAGANGLSTELSRAYPEAAGVLECRRTLALEDGRCVLADTIRTREPGPVTEVLLVRHRPEVRDGAIVSGSVRIVPVPGLTIGVEEIPIRDARMSGSFPGSLWRLTFTAPDAGEHHLLFHIERTEA